MHKRLEHSSRQKLNVSQLHALAAKKANGTVGCVKKNAAHRSREVICPLCSALVRPLTMVQQRATKMLRGLEQLSYEEKLRKLELFRPEKA